MACGGGGVQTTHLPPPKKNILILFEKCRKWGKIKINI